MATPTADDLDAAWDGVPVAPSIENLDPVEHLKRIFRGAIAANEALWRSVDLDDAVVCLQELAEARRATPLPIPVEPIRKRLVKMHAPKVRLQESLLAFAEEARAAGFGVVLPQDMDAIDEVERRRLLKGFYARVAMGGAGADARQRFLAGELVILVPPARSARLAQVLAVLVVLLGVMRLADAPPRPDTPTSTEVTMPGNGLDCVRLERQGRVLRCTMSDDAVRALQGLKKEEEAARFEVARRVATQAGLTDLLVLNQRGAPVTRR